MGEYSQHGYELSISVAVLLFQGGNKSESEGDLRKKRFMFARISPPVHKNGQKFRTND